MLITSNIWNFIRLMKTDFVVAILAISCVFFLMENLLFLFLGYYFSYIDMFNKLY